MKLKKNEILIIGGSGSIGSVITNYLFKKKLDPIVVDKNKNKNIKNFFKIDLNNKLIIENSLKKIFKKYPRIKILINCNGLIHNELIYDFIKKKVHSEKNLINIFKQNVIIPFLTSGYFVKHMIEKSSKESLIINFSSVNSNGVVGQSGYSASKKSIEILTKTWSKEFSNHKIRFACIAPGYINLQSTNNKTKKQKLKKIINEIPIKRLGKKNEILNAILFIIKNDYFNGKVLQIDGGL